MPPLIPHLLPKRHSPHSSRFLTDWISQPPSRDLADHMRSLCELLMDTNLPLMKSLQVKKVVSLLSAEEGNLALFKEIRDTLECVLSMLLSTRHVWDVKYKPLPQKGGKKGDIPILIPRGMGMGSDLGHLLPHLLAISTSECGLDTNPKDLTMSCIAILDLIKGSIAGDEDESNDVCTTDVNNRIPKEFFIYYEESFRNQLSRRNVLVDKMHRELESAASALMKAVKDDYPVTGIVKHDLLNNLLCFTEVKKASKRGGRKKVTSSVSIDIDSDSDGDGEDEMAQQKESDSLPIIATPSTATATTTAKSIAEDKKKSDVEYYHPLDKKHGKPMATKWTTKKVDAALARYLDVTERSIEVTRQGKIDILFEILFFCFYDFIILQLHHVLLYMFHYQPQLQP